MAHHIKIKTCGCKGCRDNRSRHRAKDKGVTKAFNKAIRRENKRVAKGEIEEVDPSTYSGYYWA